MVYWLTWAVARLVMWTQARLVAEKARHAPRRGPMLLVSNHLGPGDPVVIGMHLRRQMHILAKAELFDVPIFGWLIRRAGVVPIRRGASDRDALRAVAHLLSRGHCALIFPEGTYSDPPEAPEMLPWRTGAAWLALRTGATVVPVGICGTENMWVPERGWHVGSRPKIRVRFGEPYTPALPPGVPLKSALESATHDMALRVAALLPPEYRGVYAAATEDQSHAVLATIRDTHIAGS